LVEGGIIAGAYGKSACVDEYFGAYISIQIHLHNVQSSSDNIR